MLTIGDFNGFGGFLGHPVFSKSRNLGLNAFCIVSAAPKLGNVVKERFNY